MNDNQQYLIFTVIHDSPSNGMRITDANDNPHPAKTQVYLLNPGERFLGFGGSSTGLVAQKTASLITRHIQFDVIQDTEYHINSGKGREIWKHLIKRINMGDTVYYNEQSSAVPSVPEKG